MAKALTYEDQYWNPDTERGIQGAQKFPFRRFKRPKTVSGQFEKELRVQAQIEKAAVERKERLSEKKTARLERATNASSLPGQTKAAASLATKTKAKPGVGVGGAMSLWFGYIPSFWIYFLGFFFTICGLVAFVSDDTFVGWLVGTVAFEPEGIGMFFMYLNAFMMGGAFLVYGLLYVARGIHPMGTGAGFAVTMFALILSTIPVTALLPWLPLWIAYINLSVMKNVATKFLAA